MHPVCTRRRMTISRPIIYAASALRLYPTLSSEKSNPYAPLIWTSIRPGDRRFPLRSIVLMGLSLS